MRKEKRLRVRPTDKHLQSVDTVFLFGAGTSAHMKLSESADAPSCPTDASFFEVVEDDLLKSWCADSNIREIAQNARERVFAALQDAGISHDQLIIQQGAEYPKVGLEKVFCRLDMLRMLGQYIPTPPAGDRWRHPVEALRDLIAIVMANGRPTDSETGYTGFARRILANHETRRGNTYAVLSLNYDLGLEFACNDLYESDKSIYTAVREFMKKAGSPEGGRKPVFYYALPNRPPSPTNEAVPILKLHGSCNWGFCPECQNVADIWLGFSRQQSKIETLAGSESDRERCPFHSADYPLLPKHLPHIIPPTWNKWMGDYTLRHIWRQAYSVLANCEKLFVVGTSMPDTDLHLRHMIQMAFSRNLTDPQVYVVNAIGENTTTDSERRRLRKEYRDRVSAAVGLEIPRKNYRWSRFQDKDTLDWIFRKVPDTQ